MIGAADTSLLALLESEPVSRQPDSGTVLTVDSAPTAVRTTHLEPRAMGPFEAADRFDQGLASWNPIQQAADVDILSSKDILDARSIDVTRNDALVRGASNLHKDTLVGHLYMLNAHPSSRTLFGKVDEVWEKEFKEEVEEEFSIASDSPENWFDAAGRNTFSELVRLAVGVYFAGGEILAAAEWDRDPRRPFRTCLNMLDPARLSTPQRYMFDKSIRAGVKRGKFGKPESYFIMNRHPVDYNPDWNQLIPDWQEVAARKPWGRLQMIHIFEQDRPDQTRGISEIACALKELHITHKLRDINLQGLVAKSMYAAAITSDLPSEAVFASLGGGNTNTADAVSKAVTGYAAGYLNSVNAFSGGARNLQIDGVKIPHLFPGTKLELLSPGKDSPIGSEFETSLMRYLSVAAGMSAEEFSHNYSGTNYSTIKAAIAKTEKQMRARKKLTADRFASGGFRLWLEERINASAFSSVTRRMKSPGWLYEGQNLDAISRAEWIGSSRGQVDELKETQAAILRIEKGLSTYEIEVARFGSDWRKIFEQIAREKKLTEDLDILQEPLANSSINALGGKAKDKSNPKKNGAAFAPVFDDEDTDLG